MKCQLLHNYARKENKEKGGEREENKGMRRQLNLVESLAKLLHTFQRG